VAPEVGLGLRLSRAFEIDADLEVMTAIGLTTAHYDATNGVLVKNAAGDPS